MLTSEEQKNKPTNSKELIKENSNLDSKEIGAILVSKLLADDGDPSGAKSTDKNKLDKKNDEEDTDSEPTTPSHNAPRAFEKSDDLYENFPEPDYVEEELDEWYWWTDDFVIEEPEDEYDSYNL